MATGTHEYLDDPRNAEILISVNGVLVPRDEAKVSVFDSGFILGDGVWEGLRVHRGGIAFVDSHLARLYEGAKALDIERNNDEALSLFVASNLKRENELKFPVLTDVDNSYALSLGLLIWLGPEIRAIYAARGRDLPRFQGNDGWFVPVPATFVIGRDHRVLAKFADVDFRRRMPAEEVLSALGNQS